MSPTRPFSASGSPTLTNGVTVLGLYGLAFVGGWVEQIGTIAGNAAARYIGIAASLLVPSESLWQLASHHMQPRSRATSASGSSPPSRCRAPPWWPGRGAYVLVTLAIALRLFRSRDL